MHTRRSPHLLAAFLGLTALTAPVLAQTTAKEAEKPYDEQLTKYYHATNENHRTLDAMAGKWTGEITAWGFGSPPPSYLLLIKMENRWLYDGRYLESRAVRFDGTTPEHLAKGASYEGVHYYGYDNKRKVFWTLVLGNDHTVFLRGEGSFDPETKKLKLSGPELSPVSGDTFTRTEIFGLAKQDELTYELRYGFPDGSEIKAAAGVFRRDRQP